jgi:hypothetical protein
MFAYIWFWLNPLTWLISYFSLEGAARSVAALTTGEVYGTLPLWAVDFAMRRMHRHRSEPPLVADEITAGDGSCDMKIASCRPKLAWKYPFTIRYAGAYFQVVASADLGAGPRPHVYSLRRLPPGEIARGLQDYRPEDVLSELSTLRRPGIKTMSGVR